MGNFFSSPPAQSPTEAQSDPQRKRIFYQPCSRTILAYKSQQKGFTLLEMAIVIAIVVLLSAIAYYSAQDSIARYRLMHVSRLLQADIQMLRALAINTSRQTRLKLVAADTAMDPEEPQVGEWLLQVGNRSERSNEWDTLPLNVGTEVNDDAGERSLSEGGSEESPWISLESWHPLVGPGLINADAIVFSPRGWLENPPGDFVNGYIPLVLVNKRAALNGTSEERVTLKVSRAGLARMELWSGPSQLPSNPVGTAEASTP